MAQQQNTDANNKSHVYVQKPDGEEITLPPGNLSEGPGAKGDEGKQTAEATPTTHSKEVTDGEDA